MRHEGECLCGQIRYAVTQPPLRVYNCSCRFCQKMSGTAGNVMVTFLVENFEILSGFPHVYEHVSERLLHFGCFPVCSIQVVQERS